MSKQTEIKIEVREMPDGTFSRNGQFPYGEIEKKLIGLSATESLYIECNHEKIESYITYLQSTMKKKGHTVKRIKKNGAYYLWIRNN